MAFQRGSRFPRTSGRSQRRKTSWSVGPQSGTEGIPATTISSSISAVGGVGVAVLEDGLTLVRTRGEAVLQLVTAAAAGDGFAGALGIANVTSNAIGVGITAVPTPITDDNWDGWLYHRFFALISSGAITANAATDTDQVLPTSGSLRFEIDSKAMRKVNSDTSLIFVIQVSLVGTASMFWSANSRMLFKLP